MIADPVLFFGRLEAEAGIEATKNRIEALTATVDLLKTHPEAQPNEPLTLEGLEAYKATGLTPEKMEHILDAIVLSWRRLE